MATVKHKVAGTADTTSLQRANSVCLLGDSITAFNLTVDSSQYTFNPTGYFTWANVLLGSRLELLNITDGGGGVGGDKTSDMLARVEGDVIGFNPGWCIVLGGVNDIPSRTAAQIKADLQAIYENCLNADINVVAITFWENTTASWTDAQRAAWLDVNQWIREYCRTNKGMFLVDGCALVTDADAMPAAGSTSTHKTGWTDGVHPRPVFARALGQEIANIITDFVPALKDSVSSMMDRYAYSTSIKQLVDNPTMQQTITQPAAVAAGVAVGGGTVAAGYQTLILTGSPTVTESLVTDPSPEAVGNAQRINIVPDGTATANAAWMRWNPALGPGGGRTAIGDEVYLECYVKISGTITAFRGIEVRLFTNSGGSTVNGKIFADNANTWEQAGWEGMLRTPPITLETGATTVQPRFYIYCDASAPITDSIDVDISRVAVYKNKGT